jgi:hypothetical protein
MVLDLAIEEAVAKELYPTSFRLTRNVDEMGLAIMADRLQAYLDAPKASKPFGYEFEIDFGPAVVRADNDMNGIADHYYDHISQMWSSSHSAIKMFGITTGCRRETMVGCGQYIMDYPDDDAC